MPSDTLRKKVERPMESIAAASDALTRTFSMQSLYKNPAARAGKFQSLAVTASIRSIAPVTAAPVLQTP